jgi:hypothetical protein
MDHTNYPPTNNITLLQLKLRKQQPSRHMHEGPGDVDDLTLDQSSQSYGQSAYQTPLPRHFPDLVYGNTSATIPPQFGYAPFPAAPQRVHFG